MAMNSTNRQNPFMYLLESKNDELQSNALMTMKSFIIMTLLEIELLILFVIFCVVTHTCNIFMLLSIARPYIVLWRQTISIVKYVNKESSYVNDIIFSDKYKYIDLNNEQLLSRINKYNINIGKVETIHDCDKFFILIQLIYNGCFFIYFLVLIIK